MSHQMENRADLIVALTALTDRLTAPELTLAEANRLRAELADVLERVRGAGRPAAPAPSRPICYEFPLTPCDHCLCAAG